MKLKIIVLICLLGITAFPAFSEDSLEADGKQGRNPKTALFLSFVLPGSGQLYNGKILKASIYVGADLYMGYNAWKNQRDFGRTSDVKLRDERNKYLWWGAGTYLLGAIDAYVDAHLSLFPSTDVTVALSPDFRPELRLSYKFLK